MAHLVNTPQLAFPFRMTEAGEVWTNLARNPLYRTIYDDDAVFGNYYDPPGHHAVNNWFPHSSPYAKVFYFETGTSVNDPNQSAFGKKIYGVKAGKTYTAAVWVRATRDLWMQVAQSGLLYGPSIDNRYYAEPATVVGNSVYQRAVVEFTPTADGDVNVYFAFQNAHGGVAAVVPFVSTGSDMFAYDDWFVAEGTWDDPADIPEAFDGDSASSGWLGTPYESASRGGPGYGRAIGPAVVEQDSSEDAYQNAVMVMRYRRGQRTGLPEFGIPDPALREGGASQAEIIQSVTTWEPDVDIDVVKSLIEEGVEHVEVSIGVYDQDPDLG